MPGRPRPTGPRAPVRRPTVACPGSRARRQLGPSGAPGAVTPRRLACHRTVAGAARWHIRRHGGPHDGACERPAGGARFGDEPGTCPVPWAGKLTVARTCVLIKTASHVARTCVLIICMSQASHGPWPRSDVIPWCRQNGRIAAPGTADRPMTWRDPLGGSAASGRAIARAPARRGRRSSRPATGCARDRGARPAGPAVPVGADASRRRPSRSLLVLGSGEPGAAVGSARPRPANARAPGRAITT
jgi:hypothetical protein